MRIKDKLTYRLLETMARRIRRLSMSKRNRFASRLGAFAYNKMPIRKKEALKNIKKAFSDKSQRWVNNTLKGTYQIMCSNFLEMLSIPEVTKSFNFKIKNKHVLDGALKLQKGVILVTGHFGPWETWGSWLGENGYPVWGIIQRQGNKGADLFFKELRDSYGMKQIYRKSSLDDMYKLFEQNKILILASDQDAKRKGAFVDFFGHPTSTAKGPAIFHMRTEAPMIFSTGYKDKDGSIVISFARVTVIGEKSIESITQTYTKMLESEIRKHPDHYFWFHRKWKTHPQT